MPRRKTPTRAQLRDTLAREREIDEETAGDSAETVDSEAQTIERLQAALSDGADSHIWLVRVNEIFKTPGGIKEGWAFNADLGEISTLRERIAQECGPGSYRCRVLRDGLPFKQYDLEIRMTMAQRRQLTQPPAAVPAIASPPGQPSVDGISPGLARILENQNRLIESIANRPAPDPTQAMNQALQLMQTMQGMMPKPPESDVGFKMFMQAFELAQKIQGDKGDSGGEGSNLIDLVRDALQNLGPELLKRLPVQPPQPMPMAAPALAAPPVQVQPPVQHPAPAAPVAPPVQRPQTDQEAVAQLKAYLLKEAQKGTDPAMCADYAMETMPVELWDAIGNAPNPLALLLQYFPEAKAHQGWFEKLIAEFFEEGEVKPDLEPAADAAARPN